MTTYDFDYITAGRNAGDMPWRDPADPNIAYHIRERNELDLVGPFGFEAVKINLLTGVATVLQFWDRATDYDDYGACFDDPSDIGSQTNICGSVSGTKLYQFAQSGTEHNDQCDNVIIEFNKSDMSISKFFASSTNVAQRDQGVCVCNAAGTLVARAGSQDYPAAFNGSLIELYRPVDDAYGYVNLKSLLAINGMVGLHYVSQSPIAFDAQGFLWVIEQPFTIASPDRQNAESILHKLSVTDLGGGALSLSLEASYTIPDEHYVWASSQGGLLDFADSYGHKRFVFDHDALKFYLWSSWYSLSGTEEGWFFEFDPATETFTRGPLDWSPPLSGDQGGFIVLDSRGYVCDGKYAVISRPTGPSTFHIVLFDIASGTEVQHPLASFPNDIVNEGQYAGGGMTLWHVSDGDNSYIYAFDVRSENVGGFLEYQDGLFYIEEVVAESGISGGAGMQLDTFGCILSAQVFALEVRDLNSVLELGPFRFVEQKESDETSMITTLILGLTEVDIGIVVEVDMALIVGNVDMDTLVDVLGDDVEIDMGEGVDNSDDFTLKLLGNDDGSTYPGAPIEFKPEELDPIEDRGSTKQYSPLGYSYIYHRVQLHATEIDEKYAVKFVDIGGQLTGRLK